MPGQAATGLTVKHTGLALPDPTHTTQGNGTTSCVVTGHLVAALQGRVEFRSGENAQLLRDGRVDIR